MNKKLPILYKKKQKSTDYLELDPAENAIVSPTFTIPLIGCFEKDITVQTRCFCHDKTSTVGCGDVTYSYLK